MKVTCFLPLLIQNTFSADYHTQPSNIRNHLIEKNNIMKNILILTTAVLTFLFFGCEKDESSKTGSIDTSLISFTGCNTNTKSTDIDIPSVRLIGQENGKLTVKMINTEFCCGTDSVSTDRSVNVNKINVEIIDNGPFTYCFCPHDLEFSLTVLENKEYELTLIESEHAYSRDTFLVQFKYSEHLDTTITGSIPGNTISNYALDHIKTDLGGCNAMYKSAVNYNEESDTLTFNVQADTIKIFTGLNLTCCIDFGSEYEITGDTLVMRINTLNDDFCDCICYYTFDYIYTNYIGQGFYYKFYVDDYKRFEGNYNLP